MRLLTKVTIFIIIAILIALTINSLISYFIVKSTLQQDIEARQLTLSQNKIIEIDRFMHERLADLQAFATRIKVQEALTEPQFISQIELDEISRSFKEMVSAYGSWDSISIIEKQGEIIASTDEALVSQNIQNDEIENRLFNQAINGKVVYSDVIRTPEHPEGTVIFMAPVHDKNDTTDYVGVAIGELHLPAITDILNETKNAFVHLYNKEGIVFANNKSVEHPDNELWGNYYNQEIFQSALDNKDESEVLPSIHGQYETLVSYAHESGFDDYLGNNWLLTVSTPVNIAFQPAQRQALGMALSVLPIFFLVAIFIILMINKYVVTPIDKITKTSKAIAEGDLGKRVRIDSKDELGEMADNFNKMADSLVLANLQLTKRVAKKTKALNQKVKDLESSERAVVNILEDVEEEREKTAQEKEKSEAILHSIGDGVFVIDTTLKITMVNDIAAKTIGYSPKEIIGEKYDSIFRFVIENTNKRNDDFIIESMRTGRIQKMPMHTNLVAKNGSQVPVSDSAAPIKEKSKKAIGCVVVFRDVTREREIDRAKTEFVSLASHQLRTPLSAINWFSEMLMAGDAGKLSKEQKKYLDEINRGNRRMVALVNALLNVSRIEMGTLAIEPEPTNLVELSDSVLGELKPQIIKKKMKIKKEYGTDLPIIRVDPRLTRIVFQNLLSNAVKYTPTGGEIRVKLEKQKNYARVTISDNGYGIPKAQQSKIFSKLFRADNIREKVAEGTGLGLYIVKSIVDQSKGRIWFKSAENKGTSFYFTLPLQGTKKKEGTKGLIGPAE